VIGLVRARLAKKNASKITAEPAAWEAEPELDIRVRSAALESAQGPKLMFSSSRSGIPALAPALQEGDQYWV